MGRTPNTDCKQRLVEYKRKKEDLFTEMADAHNKEYADNRFYVGCNKHIDIQRFTSEVHKRVAARMNEYEATINVRREKLRILLTKEEQEHSHEATVIAQRKNYSKLNEKKERAAELERIRETERMQTVAEKKLQQYMDRCEDARTKIVKKNLIEAKNANLQQMRENEARREAERELDKMWHELTLRDIETKKEREVNDVIERFNTDKHTKEIWDLQTQAKNILNEEKERVVLEDRAEIEKFTEQMKKEQIDNLIRKRKQREETASKYQEQIKFQQQLQIQEKKKEHALDSAYLQLAQIELEKEKSKSTSDAVSAKRELHQYLQSVAELEEQRREEDRMINKVYEEYKKDIECKHYEVKCKIEKARNQLKEEVMKGRKEQIEYKKMIAEQELKMKQDDNQLLRYAVEVNGRLATEMAHQKKLASLQYRDDLLKQIEYQKIIQEREKKELERQLSAGKEEEERYEKFIKDIYSGRITAKGKHPFRKVVEQCDYYFAETNPIP
ncbi:hypothetical protein FQA39_LY10736 [Lamprigera yunnana]|nr:hypothetical protein FQA39_LY10736 [Lamprigera yunnana]